MIPNLKKIRDSVIEHTLKLDDDRLALLLLIQLSRHQNLFIHEPSDWEDSPTGWITKDQRLQDEVIAILSFIILFSFTNAYQDKNLFKEHRKEILAMHPEDFLNNSIYQSSFSQFIGKKITISSLSTHFNIPKESMRRYLNSVLESNLIKKDSIFNDLGKIIINPELGRDNIDDITVADLTGTGVQDTAIARYAYAIANKKKLGTIVQ